MVALERPPVDAPAGAPEPVDEDDTAVLDAYSMAVSAVVDTLIPSVASLRVSRGSDSWVARPSAGTSASGSRVATGSSRWSSRPAS